MPYWIVKTEPSTYSYDDLARQGTAVWDGVKNNLALKHLRQMKPGDHVLVYHTGDEKAVVGTAAVTSEAYPDPKQKNPKLADTFVKVSQKAFAACVADVAPCLKALLDSVSGHDKENQERQWERIKFLMTDDFTTTKALGWIDGERMKKDYELVQTYLGMEKPFEVTTAFSTRLLDPSIKMDASKVKK